MRRFLPAVLLSTLLLTSCIPGCARVGGGEEKGKQGKSAVQPSSPNNVPAVEQPPPAPAAASASGVETAHETPTFVIDALSWAQDYRAAFSAIGKLRAIAEARYSLKEGEVPPDIHALYEKLHRELPDISLPPEKADLLSLVRKLDQGLGKIVSKLSKPPTAAELDAAYSAREPLRPKIDMLYKRLEQER